ncbi:hypothetical protein OF829_01650 [Sphingomonas sp. LB-2]|uniref:hypothetical protein n=1 Tax=Sphingomonas caeni TaxID=2984949 RepID=UPI002232AA18|nr:hypothetical protein [Sphingomonas caeni]MCW3845928.1 hypothetical protein [Sphingomonas caeni]
MRRLMLGSLAAGVAMWLVGFIFWSPLLSWIPLAAIPDDKAQLVQQALGANLGPLGTGTYIIPSATTTAGTVLQANGPVAIVHFTNRGFPALDSASLIWGMVLAMGCAFAGALAMRIVAGGLGFAERIRLVAFFAVAVAGYSDLSQPIFNHAPWGFFLYLFVSHVLTWVAAGAVLARFMDYPEGPPEYD